MRGKWKAILWLHTLRLWRYKLSFLNLILTEMLWILLFMLGIMLFVPKGMIAQACKEAFWVITGWTLISQSSSLIGGWMSFFISIGMVEEHLLRGISPFKVIMGRLIPCTTVSIGILVLIGMLLGSMFNANVFVINRPDIIIIGIIIMIVQAISYGIVVAALSVRTGVPYNLLEVLNFALMGLLIMPLDSIRPPLNYVVSAIPYVIPMYLIRLSLRGGQIYLNPYYMLISLIESIIMSAIAIKEIEITEKYVRKNGVKGIGFM
ncbi:MAG: hypothetical protein DRJ66_01135 [Thermoprotei archaeon]|nr:MAG: hypothetical protein DRJ66_01135 [Thermoprotei archaeon]RLF17852.1 MAG: hypothetical protein DRZ82_09320 [Thermoprotei archaeon]